MVEIAPQKPKLTLPKWRWPLWLSLTLFFSSVLVFIFLKAYLAKIQTDISEINGKIKIEAGKINPQDENTVLRFKDSLDVFSKIVTNHSYFSKFFDLLGSLTHAKVVFTKIDADKEKGIIQLKGTAQNYTTLAKQMVALRENENIKNLEIKGISFGASGLEFELTIGADSKIFMKQ